MSLIHQKRLRKIILFLGAVSLVVTLVLYALRQNINLFYTPSQVNAGKVPVGVRIRIGGMVEKGSLVRGEALQIQFVLTDFDKQVVIHYQGILPDLFREGQGIVAEGQLQSNNIFIADQVLAKHDENYMPPEVKKSLKQKIKEGDR